jgi:hypothetical protein
MQRVAGGVAAQGNGFVHWNVPLKGNASIEVSFRPMGDGGVGLFLHADASRSGFLAVADLPVPGQSLDAIFRMPVGEGAQALSALIAQSNSGIQLAKNAPNTASLSRDGNKLKFTVNRGELSGDSPDFNAGKAGIGLINNGAIFDRVRITGEIDPAWLDGELRRIEAK